MRQNLYTNSRIICIFSVGMVFAHPASASPLILVCDGYSMTNVPTGGSGVVHDNWGNSAQIDVTTNQPVQVRDQMALEIDGNGTGQIRIPNALLPRIRFGSGNQMKLSDVIIGENEITANVRPGLLKIAKQYQIRVDRIQGTIEIDSYAFNSEGHFNGKCRPFDPAVAQRQF